MQNSDWIGIQYSENRYAVYRSVVLKNNTLGTVDMIFINKLFLFCFHFCDFWNLVKCMDSMVPCYSLLNMKVIWLYMVSALPPITVGRGEVRGGDVIWKFAEILWWQNFFLHLWQDKPLWVELKTNGRVIFITILLQFHYFISLETVNTQKSEVFLLRISLGNGNAFSCYLPISSNLQFQF